MAADRAGDGSVIHTAELIHDPIWCMPLASTDTLRVITDNVCRDVISVISSGPIWPTNQNSARSNGGKFAYIYRRYMHHIYVIYMPLFRIYRLAFHLPISTCHLSNNIHYFSFPYIPPGPTSYSLTPTTIQKRDKSCATFRASALQFLNLYF